LGLLQVIPDNKGDDPGEVSGTISVGGVDMTAWPPEWRARWLVSLAQRETTFPGSLQANIDHYVTGQPLRGVDTPTGAVLDAIRDEAAEQMAFAGVVAGLEEGWATEVRAGAPLMSGGEEARGFLTGLWERHTILSPVVTVIDEGLAPLDFPTQRRILDSIRGSAAAGGDGNAAAGPST
jgi:ABC-type bacteriocin/lantibiotic exporter with double-glycine peptidase domain